MSLLLDALKKAAQEKQQASSKDQAVEKHSSRDELELTLDERDLAEQPSAATSQPVQPETEALSIEPVLELDRKSATTSTVSDEALQLLIYKTNKQYRHSQKIIWGSALCIALFTLVLGGVYYYYVMVDEVESLERKHEIAMRLFESQAVESDTKPSMMVNHGVPDQQALITKKTLSPASQIKQAAVSNQSAEVFSIKRTQKDNPVSALLNKAWHAYNNMEYTIASDAYKQVLEREPRNRDALLGKAAIAVKQGEYAQASTEYKKLLQLDPRDQIAMAALSNLDEASPDAMGETKLKFMLQQRPDAAHLYFALGNLYAKQARWPEAQSEYFSAWQNSNENADYAFNLAVSLDQIGKQNEAKRFYEKSLNLSVGKNINFSIEAVKQRLSKLAAN